MMSQMRDPGLLHQLQIPTQRLADSTQPFFVFDLDLNTAANSEDNTRPAIRRANTSLPLQAHPVAIGVAVAAKVQPEVKPIHLHFKETPHQKIPSESSRITP